MYTGLSNAPNSFPCEQMRPLRVLVIANYHETGSWLSLYLEELGHTVTLATTMAEGLGLLERERQDVLISDARLPDGDGWQLLSSIQQPTPLYAVSLSGSDWNGERANSKAAGFRRHLVRPFRLTEVHAALLEATAEIEVAERKTINREGLHPLRIIVADDHEWIRTILVNVVTDTLPAAEVIAVEDGLQALEAFQQGGASFLVSNHSMPRMDGAALVSKVREQAADLPIVMVSAQPEAEIDALEAGANWFLRKEQIMEHLPRLLHQHVGKGHR